DPYHWMRDEKDKEETVKYLEAENQYAEEQLKASQALAAKMADEMTQRVPVNAQDAPWKHGDYMYYSKTPDGKREIYYRQSTASANAPEEMVLDLNALGDEKAQLEAFEPSGNNEFLAYSTDATGEGLYTIYVKDLKTGKLLADTIKGASQGLEWDAGSQYLFYAQVSEDGRPDRVMRHKIGDTGEDAVVYEEKDENYSVEVSRSNNRRYLFVLASKFGGNEIRYIDASKPTEPPVLFQKRTPDLEYYLDAMDGYFTIMTTYLSGKKLTNSALCICDAKEPTSMENWKVIQGDSPDTSILSALPVQRSLVVLDTFKGKDRLHIIDLDEGGNPISNANNHAISLPESIFSISIDQRQLPADQGKVRFTYSSPITPKTIYEYDLAKRALTELSKQQVGGYTSSLYATEQLHADLPAGDGPSTLPADMKVPITVVYRKDLMRKDGSNPGWLYGFGSYGTSQKPEFDSDIISLLDRGYVYAIAHVRGGIENGWHWYNPEGMLLNKKNTFRDFIAAAEKLFADKYVSKEKLVIHGSGAGGMLIGAVMNMRPDLAKAAIVSAPIMDLVNSLMDETQKIAIPSRAEWGDPTDAAVFDYMQSYSPYENIQKDVKYPAIFVESALNDPLLDYWHASKWVAKLR
ncbi:prolyl oligopeptidase, partial [Thamnocephalis sphaerospora]